MEKNLSPLLSGLALLFLFSACGGNNTDSYVKAPGGEKTTKTKVLEAGADLLQKKTPLSKIDAYLNGFHFYNGNLQGQMEAHHYVTQLNEDLHQAVMYDGNGPNSKLMGVEYIISEKLFKTLPLEERKLWHSHHHEVKSGTLIAPGIPEVAEHELMEKLVSTYGKIFHTWHTDRDLELPLGSPMLMMGFTKDGQLNQELVTDRDKRFNVSSQEKRKQREDIPMPQVIEGANAWEKGDIRQLQFTNNYNAPEHQH
ncbi:OBAP family protein [Rufibacter sediminis]|uniref:OBAP family protein n=1 Tax=Rufibacter sediminis TaxID=2762756 RepID=A0ABR6VMM6_9BACT|nr:OBAP family protein [Rufibacter sediminis]MBC3538134.1 OBAP family protein [Rufibacter sediminis]